MSTSSNPTADELFLMELAKSNLPFVITDDGLYRIQIGDVKIYSWTTSNDPGIFPTTPVK